MVGKNFWQNWSSSSVTKRRCSMKGSSRRTDSVMLSSIQSMIFSKKRNQNESLASPSGLASIN